MMTKKFLIAAAVVVALPLAACDHKTPAAENVVSNAENYADALENTAAEVRDDASNTADAIQAGAENKADALENKAEIVRDKAENKADAIDDAHK